MAFACLVLPASAQFRDALLIIDPVHGAAELFEGPNLDLADALTAHFIDEAQILERFGFIDQTTLDQDIPLAVGKRAERLEQHGLAALALLLLVRKRLIEAARAPRIFM